MSKRNLNIVNVFLLDEDVNVPVDNAIVFKKHNIVYEGSVEELINQIIVDENIKAKIAQHNEVRKTIKRETEIGAEISLKPVQLKDLSWKVK